MTIQQEFYNNLIKTVGTISGSVFYIYYTVLKFGNKQKPWHYAISLPLQPFGISKIKFHPCTSEYQKPHKKVFSFKFSAVSDVKYTDHHKTTFILFFKTSSINTYNLMNTKVSIFKGHIEEYFLKEMLTAKKTYVMSQQLKPIQKEM